MDALWNDFWANGITNPITVIEQISFLIFAKLLDVQESRRESMAKRLNKPLSDEDRVFPEHKKHLRWSEFRHEGGERMMGIVRDELFPFFRRELKQRNPLARYLEDAQFMIQREELLVKAVNQIEDLRLTDGDTKGDLYEHMLGKLGTAGVAGQFRTPRHIIQAMVEMMDPKPTELIGDPACGTGGFLIETLQYLHRKFTSPELVIKEEDGAVFYPGDKLEPYKDHINNKMLTGFDFDATMLRIGAMNLLLHDVTSPSIHYQDTLGNNFNERFPREADGYFDVILANPPFKGSIDAENIHPNLRSVVKTTKTELLFLNLMVRMLKVGGRAAVIVPDGVLFGSSRAHVGVRKMLVEENQLEAMISLPSGVFKPYAGVSTAILIFSKGGQTEKVWFYGVANDGLSLDDKRDPLPDFLDKEGKIPGNDLPDVVERWKKRDPNEEPNFEAKSFHVSADQIRENKYDLSYNRYHEEKHVAEETEEPKEIIRKLRTLEKEISDDLDQLEGMLG